MRDIILENRINKEVQQYKNIIVYGTGHWAEYIFPYFKKNQMLSRIYAVVDRDDSLMLGSDFQGYTVKKLLDVLGNADAIIIVSKDYWQEISERVQRVLETKNMKLPIIEIFNNIETKIRANTVEDYKQYVSYLEERQLVQKKREKFIEITTTPFKRLDTDTKIIAWYLPQYYQMDVNDKYHGKGFTEWTNSSQAIPLYTGHEQPHIPYDVGYYDLNNSEAMLRQAELAKMYGIYGFCFHYYWFSGDRIMEKPLYTLLEHKEIDISFCLNWATENWSSVWDGGQYDLIFEQKLENDDDERFMRDILPFFKDNRYIKINGKPVLIIYTVQMFQQERFLKLIKNFRSIAKANGFPDLYILLTNYDNFDTDVSEWGADGLVEFPPAGMESCPHYVPNGYINPYFDGIIFDLNKYVSEKKYIRQYKNKNVFRSAMVSFDNTSRKARNGGVIFHGATPQNYENWMTDLIKESRSTRCSEENFVFVNAWNEWAEGNHLEPDIRNGYAYLEATKDAIYKSREINVSYIENKIKDVLDRNMHPHFYILCIESLGDVIACEPIVRKLKERVIDAKITWLIKQSYAEIVKYNPFVDEVVEVSCLSEAEDYCHNLNREDSIIIDCHYNGRRCTKTNRIHQNNINPMIHEKTYFNYGALLENFSLTAGIQKISDAPVFHEMKENQTTIATEGNYVVFHCKSAELCKDWQSEKWNELANKVIEAGYEVIEIGLEAIIHSQSKKYIDCTNIHDIQAVAKIIKEAEVFVSVDSGFAHLANCYRKEAVLLFGNYKNFKRPIPYTGFYAHQRENTILYAEDGNIKSLDVDKVYEMVYKKLINIGIEKKG